jgi:hypothetical protein
LEIVGLSRIDGGDAGNAPELMAATFSGAKDQP